MTRPRQFPSREDDGAFDPIVAEAIDRRHGFVERRLIGQLHYHPELDDRMTRIEFEMLLEEAEHRFGRTW